METKGLGRSATSPPCEATLEREVPPEETPDGRPRIHHSDDGPEARAPRQVPGTPHPQGARCPIPRPALFDALPPEFAEESIDMEGTIIQRFGDGYEEADTAFGREVFRVPKMDGAFHVERRFGVVREAVTGGMFLILADGDETALRAAEAALEAVSKVPPGSGQERGQRIEGRRPQLRGHGGHHQSPLLPDARRGLGERIAGLGALRLRDHRQRTPRLDEVREGMRVGIEAATSVDGVVEIHTANYGGKLGKGKIYLHSLFG